MADELEFERPEDVDERDAEARAADADDALVVENDPEEADEARKERLEADTDDYTGNDK